MSLSHTLRGMCPATSFICICFFFVAQQSLVSQGLLIIEASDHTQAHLFGSTLLVEWSTRRTDPFLTTHNTNESQTSMLPPGFEPAIPASKRAMDRARYLLTVITFSESASYAASRFLIFSYQYLYLRTTWSHHQPVCSHCQCLPVSLRWEFKFRKQQVQLYRVRQKERPNLGES